jgi:hypothetical protein
MEWIDEQIVRAGVDEEESTIRANGYECRSDRGKSPKTIQPMRSMPRYMVNRSDNEVFPVAIKKHAMLSFIHANGYASIEARRLSDRALNRIGCS